MNKNKSSRLTFNSTKQNGFRVLMKPRSNFREPPPLFRPKTALN